MDDPAGGRVHRAVRGRRGPPAGAADRTDPDYLEARLPAVARRRAVLPDRRDPPRVGRGRRHPLVRDARRRATEAGRGRARPLHPALLLLADHGAPPIRSCPGAQDHDDLARHGGGVHLPQAVPAPVLLGRLRHARSQRAGRGLVARVGLRVPLGVGHCGRDRRAHRGRGPRLPLGAPHGRRQHRKLGRHRGRYRRGRGRRPRHFLGRNVGRPCSRQPLRRPTVACCWVGTGRTAPPLPLPTNGASPTANGGSAGWARGGGAGAGSRGPTQPPVRTTGPMPAAPTAPIPPSRPTPSAARQPGATRTAPTPRSSDAVHTDAVHTDTGRAAVLVAVSPSAPVAESANGTFARPATAAVRRRRHRAGGPRHLRDPRAEP